ncbi:putative ABC transport system permease protein [Dyadobacter sp. BE34]|uniref:ABC transport system permease protein n=1 Tax=Dyadobacter fermentans TaxID=94254 RepID=A0ABU1QY71_9BACT|nr:MULTISPECIES: ABC transporter permease [Dyadobacter]MDR6805952.1 putative ABC transport system permease protein [Dyadobacter fermentans]MDR7043692.1 putative ABC transport system permease protein [Dyadobacter sp. BE242]MDR7198004.1 putative ABC transport system permease protein [Dyadobacter sp. BE34]MDR7215966.1 putative ABC transport system permease protein [Dyadobacter sp. BE31]MDR7264508.1 putative ABC transport system permease protein [Dyadobacter sp. BE32]
MLHNYFKIAFRSLWKYKANSTASIAGLSIGIGCFLLLATYVLREVRYDRFQQYAQRMVRVNLFYQSGNGEPTYTAVTPTGIAPLFAREFAEIERGVRLYPLSSGGSVAVQYKDQLFNERSVLFADSSFFQVFTFPFVEGDPKTALSQPNAVVIDETTARKYFGQESAIGKTVKMDERYTMLVTGVVKDVPSYSHIKFNWLGSYRTLPRSRTEVFDSADDYTYLLLKENASRQTLQAKIDALVNKNFNNPQDPSSKVRLMLEPFSEIHLYSTASNAMEASGNYKYIYILGGIAALILLIACINFVNLVTARASIRAREAGVRKVIGAVRRQLFIQHLLESGLITVAATVIGLLAAILCLPGLSNLTGSALNLAVWPDFTFPLLIGMLIVVVTLLSGAYPAIVLSGFEPVRVLKGHALTLSDRGRLRNGLVVFQFSVSMLFIIATLIANQQLDFIQNKNLGLNPDQVIVLDMAAGISPAKLDAIKSELLSHAGVQSVSASYDSPLNVQGGYSITAEDKPNGYYMNITAIPVEKDFVQTMGMKLVEGEAYNDTDIAQSTRDSASLRSYAFLLNESAVKALGWTPAAAIGKTVNMNGRKGKVKGVLQDFHFRSMHEKISSIALIPEYDYFGKVLIKTRGGDARQTIEILAKIWKKNFPLRPFDYHFMDQEFADIYKAESKVSTILRLFSLVTILISCLGLFGLIAFISQQRTKEIGVRKVLGASVASIVMLLSIDFVKLVLVAIVLASPLAWYFMDQWLSDFAYRVQIGPWLFMVAGLIAVLITFFTISFQSIKAALMDPVKALKME